MPAQPQKCSTCVLPARPKASWDSFALKRSSHRQHLPDNARNFRGRANTDRSPIQMRYLARYIGPRSGAPSTHTTAETPRARAFNTQRRITGSLCTQKVCARNMRHLRTLARATSNLSSIKMHHTERHTGREWRIHPARTHTRTETLRMLTLTPSKRPPRPPFALKKCSHHTTPPKMRASLGRASNLSPIKMHHFERCTAPEWRANAQNRRRPCQKRAASPLQSYGARTRTSHSAQLVFE